MLNIKLDQFEGPFDLLLKLIDKNKINIYDIPISKLTKDYVDFIENSKIFNMNEMSEFIVMSSILLEIKSKILLPKEVDENTKLEIDPRKELMLKLLEYKKYKNMALELSTLEPTLNEIAFKSRDIILDLDNLVSLDEILDNVTLSKLYDIYIDTLKRKEAKIDKIRNNFKSVTKSLYSVKDKINYVRDLLVLSSQINFAYIFEISFSKTEVIVTFLAILELVKGLEIKIYQDGANGEIIITKGDLLNV